MKELYDACQGANILSGVPTNGYTYDDSEAVVDGKFVGLAIDNVNEEEKTEERLNAWIDTIKPAL